MSRYKLILVRVADGKFDGRRLERVLDFEDYFDMVASDIDCNAFWRLRHAMHEAELDHRSPATATVPR